MPSTRFRHRRIAEARCRVDWSHVNSPHNLAQTLARNLRPNPQELEKTPGRATSGSGRYTLAAAQNADGGWGYFPGKQSWLEPTVYALLALSAQSGEPAFARGWRLIRSWELPGGGWRGCAAVNEAHWATSLVVTLHAALGVYDAAFDRGVAHGLHRRRRPAAFTYGALAAAQHRGVRSGVDRLGLAGGSFLVD